MPIERHWRMGLIVLAAPFVLATASPAQQAQQLPPASQGSPAGQAQPPARPPAKPAPTTKAAPAKDAPRAEGQGDAQLRARIEQLEEQLSDMQIHVGTLESLARGGNASVGGAGSTARAPAASGGVDQARLDSLETQIRALASQLEQVSAQVRQLSTGRRTEASPPPSGPQVAAAPLPGGFGSTIVTPRERDPIGSILSADSATLPPPSLPPASQPLPPAAAAAGNPRELYETAYGYLLQQDYGAAEVAFEEFLRRHPGDRLAADAQYWLGETLYVQRRYKPAGQAFLTVVEKHKTSAKVPNSLLKLAQSLDQLGQKDCGIFNELETRHPNAPADVRTRARALKQRQGC